MSENIDEKFYVVTSTCKDDMREVLKDKPKMLKLIDQLNDDQMKWIARKLEDDYVNQLYWSSLQIIVEGLLESTPHPTR